MNPKDDFLEVFYLMMGLLCLVLVPLIALWAFVEICYAITGASL